jgi:hypothetical protein
MALMVPLTRPQTVTFCAITLPSICAPSPIRRWRRGRSRRAQQPAIPVVGFLDSRSPGEDASGALAFQKGLGDVGFVEGHNVKLDSRWAEGQYDRLPALVADLIRHRSCIA